MIRRKSINSNELIQGRCFKKHCFAKIKNVITVKAEQIVIKEASECPEKQAAELLLLKRVKNMVNVILKFQFPVCGAGPNA